MKKTVEAEPSIAIQFLQLHGTQVHGLPSMHRAATTDNTPTATSSKDTSSNDTRSKNTSSEDNCAKDTHFKDTRSRETSSSKQRRAKGNKKEQASSATTGVKDALSNRALLNFGHLLNLYQSSPTPPLLTCTWPTCNFVTQAVGMEEGKPVGAEPAIAIQLLRLHVEYDHSKTDLEFLPFLLLEKMLHALPRPPPSRPLSTHTAPGTKPGLQEGAGVKVGQQGKSVTSKSTSLEKEGSTGISLHCQQCHFVTKRLKPSKANQRLSSHLNSHHPETASPPSPREEEHIQHVLQPPLCQEEAVPAPPLSASQEDTCQLVLPHAHLMGEPSSPHQGDATPAPPSSPGPEDHSQPVPMP